MSKLATLPVNISYDKELDVISSFLEKYTLVGSTVPKFLPILQRVANRETKSILVELDDIAKFEETEFGLAKRISENAKTYLELFSYTLDLLLPAPNVDISVQSDVVDVIMTQRRQQNQLANEQELPSFPPLLTRRFAVSFKPLTSAKSLSIRELKGKHIGKLLTLRGIVTRVTDVKPLLVVNAYNCEQCGSEIFQEVKNKSFTPLFECPSDTCKRNQTKGKLQMQTRASKFLKFQEAKIQEMADQVPVGHTPRYSTIHLYEELTRTINPGDVVNISGIFLTTPFTGFKALRAGLLTDTFVQAQFIHQHKKTDEDSAMDNDMAKTIEDLNAGPDVYGRLARSIAPEIYGHEDVKKALLLLLVGGGTKTTQDGMKIRGDINICLMGDPGVAKSQLLKFISKIAPRGVYTTGRGSSGVGLTAAVMRDTVTDELVLEGGALVLADNGICCIDEFDKMDDQDRTAIHEVMEQQTISISKAGINTTLNARASILAAANPAYGRYNIHRSPTENINLPAALLSRFDLLFLLLDLPSRDEDRLLAHHVTQVHIHNAVTTTAATDMIPPNVIRQYVAQAKTINTTISPSVVDFIVSSYVQMRKIQSLESEENKNGIITARSLLAIIRLSQALARVRFSDRVEATDVVEALRLIDVTKSVLETTRRSNRDTDVAQDRTLDSAIYRTIREMRKEGEDGEAIKELRMRDIKERVLANGFSEQDLNACIERYKATNVWTTNRPGTTLTFV